REHLGWPEEKFSIPSKALDHFRKAVVKGQKAEGTWNDLLTRYRQKYPDLARQWDAMLKRDNGTDYKKHIPAFKPSDGPMATRSASGKVLNSIAAALPQLVGGSADLTPSNNTYLKDYADFRKENGGRNLHFGVREHAMGAVLNGMALSKMLIPYGGTFLIFSDYMKPAIRLAALMEAHTIYVFTHDSVGLGEDGPTHQPIEQLTSLRAMPHITVIRPADANETAMAWEIALEHKHGPVALILTRQNLPIIDRDKYAPARSIERGGYVLADSAGLPEIILIASGSEVALALSAYEKLAADGINARLVNIASFELFERQPESYRNEVLLPSVEKRLVIEAGATLGWYKYAGLKGDVLGIDRFGASAPAKVIFEKLGFTVDNVIARAKALLNK
ncbi:MAG: transketolase-like TK C-terminal-containing protein, partial [bacterium]